MKPSWNQPCTAKLDRVRVVGGFRWPAQLPTVRHFTTVTDSFVRGQTTVRTYLRCRRLIHPERGTQVYWQYWPQHCWLKPWRITIVADDVRGLWMGDLEPFVRLCDLYSIPLLELAIDFQACTGIDKTFVRRHGVFGKSRPRLDRGGGDQLRYGTRQSDKLVRAYAKPSVGAFRIELETHSRILRRAAISDVKDAPALARFLIPTHFEFAELEWPNLRRHLLLKFGRLGSELFAATETHAHSLHRALGFLRRAGVRNVHRFLRIRPETNLAKAAIERWAAEFKDGAL